jgi:hypothetical protein
VMTLPLSKEAQTLVHNDKILGRERERAGVAVVVVDPNPSTGASYRTGGVPPLDMNTNTRARPFEENETDTSPVGNPADFQSAMGFAGLPVPDTSVSQAPQRADSQVVHDEDPQREAEMEAIYQIPLARRRCIEEREERRQLRREARERGDEAALREFRARSPGPITSYSHSIDAPMSEAARHASHEQIQMGDLLMGAGLPDMNDRMPEIGHGDDASDVTTNPSIINGRIGGVDNGSSVEEVQAEYERVKKERQRAVSSISDGDQGLARHDGTRIRSYDRYIPSSDGGAATLQAEIDAAEGVMSSKKSSLIGKIEPRTSQRRDCLEIPQNKTDDLSSGRGTSIEITPTITRHATNATKQSHTLERYGTTTTDLGNRRKVAKALIAISKFLGTASHKRLDDSEFKHGKALDFPDIPAEEQRNSTLPQIRTQYNQVRDNKGERDPAVTSEPTNPVTMEKITRVAKSVSRKRNSIFRELQFNKPLATSKSPSTVLTKITAIRATNSKNKTEAPTTETNKGERPSLPEVTGDPNSVEDVGRYFYRPSMTSFDDDSDDDREAATGLEAMKIAEEQDAQRDVSLNPGLDFRTYSHSVPTDDSPEEAQDERDDSDFESVDLGLVGGGYDAHMSYGGDVEEEISVVEELLSQWTTLSTTAYKQ